MVAADLFTIKKVIAAVFMPLPIALLLIFIGLWLAGRRRPTGLFLAGAGAMVILLASWGPVADALLLPLEKKYPPLLDAGKYRGKIAIVVLGSGYNPDPSLPVTSQLADSAMIRLSEGIRLYRQLPGARLVLTGGSVFDSGAAAHGYAEAAQALGVPGKDLAILDTPRDTAQEAQAVRKLLGERHALLLVTSASHMPRSMDLFQKAGLSPMPAPTRHKSLREDRSRFSYWVPSALHLRKTERAIYEYLALLGGAVAP
jgi:uncharacterized SAM-binding protein YcdF (DUF218 family)